MAGSVGATFHAPFWAALPSAGEVVLGERLGWGPAVGLQLAALGLLAALVRRTERRQRGGAAPGCRPDRPRAGQVACQSGDRRRRGSGAWPLAAGAVGLAGLNALTLAVAGHPWTITWAFTLWGGKALQAEGHDLSGVPFWTGEFQRAALAAPVLADVTSVMDIGLVLGAALAAVHGGRFAPRWRLPAPVIVTSILGGLLMGYGARIAFGCNIGAYTSGIASTSLHGWLWAAGAAAGTPAGVRLRARLGLERGHGRPPRGAA